MDGLQIYGTSDEISCRCRKQLFVVDFQQAFAPLVAVELVLEESSLQFRILAEQANLGFEQRASPNHAAK